VANGEVSGRYVRVNVSVGEVREPCRSIAVGAAWILGEVTVVTSTLPTKARVSG
jgi:hypothetical protein